jgi:hypothetical protein
MIPVTINAKSGGKNSGFNVVIENPQGTKFDEKTDGGEESCICHVTIKTANAGQQDMLSAMKERVHSANAIMGA